MHAPGFPIVRNECTQKGLTNQQCRQETWKALSELRNKGIMRNIGVSNFNAQHMKDIQLLDDNMAAPIACNQFQYNAFVPQAQQDIYDYCQQHGIAVTAFYSLGGTVQRAQAATVATLQDLADKYDVTVAKLMLRWSLQKGATVIPGTGNPKHMKENLDVYNFEIDSQDMAVIDGLRHDQVANQFLYVDPEKMFAAD